jgi:hypothetical protein
MQIEHQEVSKTTYYNIEVEHFNGTSTYSYSNHLYNEQENLLQRESGDELNDSDTERLHRYIRQYITN